VIEMTKSMFVVLCIVVPIAVVVSVDFLFFKNRFWERLLVNIGIVLVFAAFYLRFLKNPQAKRRGTSGCLTSTSSPIAYRLGQQQAKSRP
jgi:hypothetical protein